MGGDTGGALAVPRGRPEDRVAPEPAQDLDLPTLDGDRATKRYAGINPGKRR
jgi:hypothetical protein